MGFGVVEGCLGLIFLRENKEKFSSIASSITVRRVETPDFIGRRMRRKRMRFERTQGMKSVMMRLNKKKRKDWKRKLKSMEERQIQRMENKSTCVIDLIFNRHWSPVFQIN